MDGAERGPFFDMCEFCCVLLFFLQWSWLIGWLVDGWLVWWGLQADERVGVMKGLAGFDIPDRKARIYDTSSNLAG